MNPNARLAAIPLDDPGAFQILNDRKYCGVFQFAGAALQRLCEQMVITEFEDLVAITALARPGPMDSGAAEKWVRRKTGREPVTYPHPIFEPILRDTLGVVLFQESVMRIGREVGNLSWPDVNALRKAIGKSQGAEKFNEFGDKWKVGAIANGVDKDVADRVWNELCTFGRYGFVKAHATAYSVISYHCCWFKHYYPLEFASATLDAEPDPAKQIALLKELKAEGISYVPVDVDRSINKWVPAEKDGKRFLVGPLTAIKGIGPSAVLEIIDCRKQGKSIREALRKRLVAAKTEIDTLTPIADAIARVDLKALNITSTPTAIGDVKTGMQGDVMIMGVLNRIQQINENEPERVAKRNGRRVSGPEDALNIFIADDTGEMFAKVHARSFHSLGRMILDKGTAGKSLFALKGGVSSGDFKMLWINDARYIGEIE